MTSLQPGVLVGTVRHRRFTPRQHQFSYPVFLALLDIDRIPDLMRVSALTSYNRWNWAAYDERDHFGDPSRPLRERLHADAREAGLQVPEGPIYLLTHLRYLGYCFNPVSFFYCHDTDGSLRTVLAEVNNTFGETRNYWLSPAVEAGRATARSKRYHTPKDFHVSPFNQLRQSYEWVLAPPGDRTVVHMNTVDQGRIVMDATMTLRYRPWTAAEIRRVLVRFPFVTAKVMAAIHYEALRLYLKGVPFVPHPGTPPSAGRPRRFDPARDRLAPIAQQPPLQRAMPVDLALPVNVMNQRQD